MALVSPTPINDPALPLPDRADRATFADRMAEQFRWQREDLASGAETLAQQAYENAAEAVSAATGALAASNYKGEWSTLSGALAIPASVHHSGNFWALLQSVPDVAAVTPGVSPVWAQIGGVSKSGDTMTGPLNVPAGAIGPQVPQAQEVVRITGSTGSARLPVGTTAQRDASPANGMFRQNSTTGRPEYYNGTEWVTVGRAGRIRQSTTSGTAIDFTGIPAWASKIELVFEGVSFNAGDDLLIQLGDSSGIVTTGYTSESYRIHPSSTYVYSTTSSEGLIVALGASGRSAYGSMTIYKPESGNVYVSTSEYALEGAGFVGAGGTGRVSLTDVITQIRLTRSGSAYFDAGAVTLYWS